MQASVPAPSTLATRPVRFSRITKHESRNTAFMLFTNHESRHFWLPGRCFPARCGAASGGYGAAWAAAVPRAGNTACWVFTSNESRNMFFPCPPATPRRATPSPAYGFFTSHESRDAKHGFYAFLPTISHNFPRFPGISRPLPPHPIKGPRAVRRSRWQPEVKPRVASREVRCPADKERRGSILDIFDRGATQFRRDASPLNLHFSLRGEAKCVRGPSGRGASRLARAGVLEQYVEHGKQAQRSPGGRIACFDRRVVRNAG